jgi:hypothetical protein
MVTWEDAFEIRDTPYTYDVYKKGTDDMMAYSSSKEEAIRIAKTLFKISESIIEEQLLLDLGGEDESNK